MKSYIIQSIRHLQQSFNAIKCKKDCKNRFIKSNFIKHAKLEEI